MPFVPVDEDYGLITIEAMKSSRPVLTVLDSGGPCEFVEHGKTGFVCQPQASALAEWMTRLASDPDETRRMGEAAYARVADVHWDTVAKGLMEIVTPDVRSRKLRPKLTVATTFKVYPPMNGGQARVFHLYRNLAKSYDIDIVALGSTSDVRSEVEIAPGVMEITIPKTDAQAETEYHISRQLEDKRSAMWR